MKAFLFAGGLGTRLKPYTYDIPKPLLKIYDKPIIYYILKYLSNIGVNEVWINTCYLKEQFKDLKKFEEELHLSINLSEQDRLYFHGGDLSFAKDFWNSVIDDEVFLAINADTLFYIDSKEIELLAEKVNKENPLAVIGMQSAANPLKIQEGNLVGIGDRFYKTPANDKTITFGDSFGVYLMHSSIREVIGKPEDEKGFYDSDGIVGEIISRGKNVLYEEIPNVKRAEIGTVEDYEMYKDNMEIKKVIKLLEK